MSHDLHFEAHVITNLQKYRKVIIKANNKLVKLNNILSELVITCVFLEKLIKLYQALKNIYLKSYNKNNIDRNKKMIILTIEEMLKLLINKKNKAKISRLKN